MFSFSACFWSNYVYIGKKKYAANEILTAYLNTNHLSSAEIFLDDLKDLKTRLILTDDMSYDNLKNYNKNVYLAIAIFQKIDSWMRNLPPYKHLLSRNAFGFDDLLNHHSFFFDDGQNEFDEPITWDTVSEFGCGEQNEFGNWQIRIHKFSPIGYEENELTDENMREALRETNRDISNYFNQHIEFLKSYITIHQVFKPFIKDYLHHKETSINANEMAQICLVYTSDAADEVLGVDLGGGG
ncbi:MAG: hypothetical protein LUF33_02130, partial [Clostridiales bacterium]|nr:hypothetical protein [Clostridiales bacterium]